MTTQSTSGERQHAAEPKEITAPALYAALCKQLEHDYISDEDEADLTAVVVDGTVNLEEMALELKEMLK